MDRLASQRIPHQVAFILVAARLGAWASLAPPAAPATHCAEFFAAPKQVGCEVIACTFAGGGVNFLSSNS